MEQDIPQIDVYGTLAFIITLICGLAIASHKYWTPTIGRYFQNGKNDNIKIADTYGIKYNSEIDDRDVFILNQNIREIIVHTTHIKMSYGRCLRTCSMKKELESLTLSTGDVENTQTAIYKPNAMTNLTTLALVIENAEYLNNDYLLPILQNAINLESIVYENGHLSTESMNLLINLPKLDLLILEKVHVTDPKAFSIMLFNLKVRQLAYHLKYGIY